MDIKRVFHFSLQVLFETYFTPTNILSIMLKTLTETHVGLHVLPLCLILTKTGMYQQIVFKHPNNHFDENPFLICFMCRYERMDK